MTGVKTVDSSGETILADNISYLPFGPVEQLTYGNGLGLSRGYNLDYRIAQQDVGNIQSLSYGFDGNNNIENVTDLVDIDASRDFNYDALDRLDFESGNYGDKTYQYDAVGNRIERVSVFTGEVGVEQTLTQTLEYEAGSNRLVQRDSKAVVLDVNGNTLIAGNDENRTFDYDAQNRMAASYKQGQLQATYHYNALGQRVIKQRHKLNNNDEIINSRQIVYHYDLNGQMLGESVFNRTGVLLSHNHFIWLDNLPLARIKELYNSDGSLKSTDIFYLYTDHLNAPRIATDENQIIVWRWDSDAFGVGQIDRDPDGDGVKLNVRLRFPGQYYDGETGLYYNYFRDYDRTLGRYVQSDPIGLDGGINTFAYVGGNPVNYYDPEGLRGTGRGWPNPSNQNPLDGSGSKFGGPFGPLCGSGPSASWVPDGQFSEACKKHDACYGTCGMPKALCDLMFLAGTGSIAYFTAVTAFGQQPYNKAQENTCNEDCAK